MKYETDKDLYCPSYEPEEVHQRVQSMWDFVGPIPLPNFDKPCQQCGSEMRIRQISYGMRDTGGVSFRTDVLCQCYGCFAKQTYGVPIEPEHAARAENRFDIDISARSPAIISRADLIDYFDDKEYDYRHFKDEVTLTREEKVEAAKHNWMNVKSVPVPRFDVECHQCGQGERDLRISYISYGLDQIKRCDVSFRCISCFSLFSFNVPIDDDQLNQAKEVFNIEKDITESTPALIDRSQIQEVI